MPTREEMRSLGEDIVRSYDERIKVIPELKQAEAERKRAAAREIAQCRSDVGGMLKGFDKEQAAMSKELKADLAKVRPALVGEERKRQSEAREFMGELGRAVAEGKAAARALKRELGTGVAERKSVVGAQLKELADIQAGARDEWQKLTATMQAKRAGAAVAVAPPPPVKGELRNRVFAYLANHPDGTRMTELEQKFGLARIQVAKMLRSLMDENKVEKRELLYFAI